MYESTTSVTSSENDQEVLRQSKSKPSLKQGKEEKYNRTLRIVLCIVLCVIDTGLIILILYLLNSHKSLIEILDNQQKEIKNIKQCSALYTGFTVTFREEDSVKRSWIGVDSNQTIKFNEVLENAGGGYDPNTGKFTVDTPGLYSFQIQIVANNVDHACLNLEKNGNPISRAFAENGKWETGSTSVVVEMAAGDTMASVACLNSKLSTPKSHLAHDRTTVFSGYLIEAANCKNVVQSNRLWEDISCDVANQPFFDHMSCVKDVCYFLKRESEKWNDAKAKCEKYGKILAEVRNMDQAEEMIRYVRYLNIQNSQKFWLGGTDEATEGQWVWEGSGDIITNSSFVNWTYTNPDVVAAQDCMSQWDSVNQVKLPREFGWDSESCPIKKPYLCQSFETEPC